MHTVLQWQPTGPVILQYTAYTTKRVVQAHIKDCCLNVDEVEVHVVEDNID